MTFATQYNGGSAMLSQNLPKNNPLVLPDLSFTVQEIQQKFTLQRVILEGQNAKPNYLLSNSSDEFDSAPTNVPQNYDLVDARADALRATNARLAYISALRNSKKSAYPDPAKGEEKDPPKSE